MYESPLEQDVRTGMEMLLPAKKGGNNKGRVTDVNERSESPKFIKEESTLLSNNNLGNAGWGQLVLNIFSSLPQGLDGI